VYDLPSIARNFLLCRAYARHSGICQHHPRRSADTGCRGRHGRRARPHGLGLRRHERLWGRLDNQNQDPDLSTQLDFGNDVEVYLNLNGEDEATGLAYGGTIELDADTNTTENAYETWVYLSGGWGEVRLGDEEGPVDESALGADTIAAGTGGIDGDIVDELAVDAVSPTTSDEATKIRWLFSGSGVLSGRDAGGAGKVLEW
jgi:hypothetical protein